MEKVKVLLASLGDKSFDEIKNNCEFDIKEKDNLYMLSFNKDNDLNDDMTRAVNGIILEKNTNKLVHYAFPKMYDGLVELEEEGDLYLKKLDKYNIELFVEGTLIKVFHHDGIWNIGTSRNINGSFSFWGSQKSFKQLFMETCEKSEIKLDINSLDKNYCYSYILQHPEVTIGYDITIPDIVPFNKINLKTLEETLLTGGYQIEGSIESCIKDLSFFRNYIILTEKNERIKVYSKEYKESRRLLNNNPSIKWSYLESILNKEDRQFKLFFPYKSKIFEEVDLKIIDTIDALYDLYFKIRVKHENPDVPKKLQKTLLQLHGRYKKTREKTTKDVIYNHIISLKTKILYWILDL